jgi:hypothetical protein
MQKRIRGLMTVDEEEGVNKELISEESTSALLDTVEQATGCS